MNDRRKAASKSAKAFFGDGPAEDLSPAMRVALDRLQALALHNSDPHALPLAGQYLYIDQPGAEPVRVEVAIELGQVIVRFPSLDSDDGAELLLTDMAACADWNLHFRRIA